MTLLSFSKQDNNLFVANVVMVMVLDQGHKRLTPISNKTDEILKSLERLIETRLECSGDTTSRGYALADAIIKALQSKSRFSALNDDANPLMNYLYCRSTTPIQRLISNFNQANIYSEKEISDFYHKFTPLVTDFFYSLNGKDDFTESEHLSMADWRGYIF